MKTWPVVGATHEQHRRLLRLRRVATVLVRLVVYIESAFVSVPGLVRPFGTVTLLKSWLGLTCPGSAIPSSIS
ncbi:hypothetical protein ABID62_006295 [Bradyrhizobium sp. S3.9.1]